MTLEQPSQFSNVTWPRASHTAASRPGSAVGQLLSCNDIILALDAVNKAGAFKAIADFLERRHGLDARQTRSSLEEREALGSTGLGRGVAIPHARVKGLRQAAAVFARLALPIPFDAPDGKPVCDMLVLLVPEQPDDGHLKVLANVAEMFCDANFRATLASTNDAKGIQTLFASWTS